MRGALNASDECLRELAEEQAALRRIATLVARGAATGEVFAAVTEDVGELLPVDFACMGRYGPGREITFVAAWGTGVDRFSVGSRWILEGANLSTRVFESGRSARIDSYSDASGPVGVAARERGFRSAVATPVYVEGRLWGVVTAASLGRRPLPSAIEGRLAHFTELLETAIANAESRAALGRLAEQQAALRRIATLVARGTDSGEVFSAVVEEVGRLLPAEYAHLARYEPDETLTFVAAWGRAGPVLPVGTQVVLEGRNLARIVKKTGRPARIESWTDGSGPLAAALRERGVRWSVAAPVLVEGRVWGLMAAGSILEQRLLPDTEARLADFTELLATAIANAESRADLAASRARIVAAADETRRQIERDLHDGAQQRLVSLGLELRAAQATVPDQLGQLRAELARIAEGLASVFDELRQISRGIHPAILSKGGLEPALRALARRSAVPVELWLEAERRLPEHVEVAAYYVIAEALTNVAKHAQASLVQVTLQARGGSLRLAIRDDGIGGADPARGSGLVGLSDRVEALGGTLRIVSPAGDGTSLLIEMPLEGQRSTEARKPWGRTFLPTPQR
jgi:signal transduction histidine kinase